MFFAAGPAALTALARYIPACQTLTEACSMKHLFDGPPLKAVQGGGKRREAMSHHLSRTVDNEPIAATNAITVAASAAPM
jgi:hypothetical protein